MWCWCGAKMKKKMSSSSVPRKEIKTLEWSGGNSIRRKCLTLMEQVSCCFSRLSPRRGDNYYAEHARGVILELRGNTIIRAEYSLYQ